MFQLVLNKPTVRAVLDKRNLCAYEVTQVNFLPPYLLVVTSFPDGSDWRKWLMSLLTRVNNGSHYKIWFVSKHSSAINTAFWKNKFLYFNDSLGLLYFFPSRFPTFGIWKETHNGFEGFCIFLPVRRYREHERNQGPDREGLPESSSGQPCPRGMRKF